MRGFRGTHYALLRAPLSKALCARQAVRMNSTEIGYSVLSSGNARFLRALPIPLASNMEMIAEDAGLKYAPFPEDEVFAFDARPKAIGTETAAAVGILFFVGSWLVSKILDEIYDIKLKPIIRNLIQKADEIVIFGSKKRALSFVIGIYHQDKQKLVLVVLKSTDKEDFLSKIEMISNVHAAARQNVEQPKYEAPLHLYVIEDGEVNSEPIQLNNMQQAYEHIGT
jgi:hypothetical protein